MSSIEPNIIDPGKPVPPPPGGLPAGIDPDNDELVEPDDIREPEDAPEPVQPDPEEDGGNAPAIRV